MFRTLSLILLAIMACSLALQAAPPTEERWKAFGARVILTAPAAIRNGDALTKAKWLTAKVSDYMAGQGIPPNATFTGRLESGYRYGFGRADRGTCGDVGVILGDVFEGGGLKKDARGVTAEGNPYNRADVNHEHGAIAIVSAGKVYMFDPWQYARQAGTYAGLKSSPWNGMPYDQWVSEMRKQGYQTFHLTDNSPMQDWIGNETLKEQQRAGKTRPTQATTSKGGYTSGFTGTLESLLPTDGRKWDKVDGGTSGVDRWIMWSTLGPSTRWYTRLSVYRHDPYPDQKPPQAWREADARAARDMRNYRRKVETGTSERWVPDKNHTNVIAEDTLPAALRTEEGVPAAWARKLSARSYRFDLSCLYKGTDGRTERTRVVAIMQGNVCIVVTTGALNDEVNPMDAGALANAVAARVTPFIR